MHGLEHVAIAVRSISKAAQLYTDILGLKLVETLQVPDEGIRIAVINAGGVNIELMEPLVEDSVVARFIQRRGEGIHHISFRVTDLNQRLKHVQEQGLELVFPQVRTSPRGYRYNFIHPKSANGVLIELTD